MKIPAYLHISTEFFLDMMGMPETTTVHGMFYDKENEQVTLFVSHDDIPAIASGREIVPLYKTEAITCPDCRRVVGSTPGQLVDWVGGKELQNA